MMRRKIHTSAQNHKEARRTGLNWTDEKGDSEAKITAKIVPWASWCRAL